MNAENTNQSIELVTNKLDSYIQILAEKLGVAAEYVYPLFVKQQIIESWINITISIIATIISFFVLRYGYKKTRIRGDDITPNFFILLFGFLGLMVSAFCFVVALSTGIPKLLNPEYAAIQAIIQSVK